MNVRNEQRQSTRRRIVDEATRLFTEQGYETVSIEALLKATALSRGALYHHFPGKESVLLAVLEAAEERIVEHLTAASADAQDAMDALRRGCGAWLDLAASDPVIRRIVLDDAPAVIGWQAWRALDERYTLGLIRAALGAAASQGLLPPERVDISAHILLAVLIEVALLIAKGGQTIDQQQARTTVERVIAAL